MTNDSIMSISFGSTFLVTDILSENHGKKIANRAVLISTLCSVIFIAISQMWLLYTPSENDWASEAFKTIFSNTPRIICASLGVYMIAQLADVWLYHKWWDWCKRHFGDSKKGLWIRNNGSTMISQLLNTLLYTAFAFYGTYSFSSCEIIVEPLLRIHSPFLLSPKCLLHQSHHLW